MNILYINNAVLSSYKNIKTYIKKTLDNFEKLIYNTFRKMWPGSSVG